MCGLDDPNPGCDSCLKTVCQDCCSRCKICDSVYCDDCIFDFKLILSCSNRPYCCNIDDVVCYKCYSFSDSKSDTLFCDDCRNEPKHCNSYVLYTMNPEKNKKRRRISKDDSFHYDCKEQGPNLVYGVIDLMFSFLSDRDKLLNISLVCKHYRNVLMNNTDIWMNGDGQSVVTQREKMLFIHNLPTTKIRFPIQCVGLSLKIINYLLRDNHVDKDIVSYWPKSIDSFRCAYAIEVVKRLFGSEWKWKTGFTEHLTGNYFQHRRDEVYTQCAIEHVHDLRIWKLFTFQDLSALISTEEEDFDSDGEL